MTIKASLENLPDGEFRFEDWVDGDVHQDRCYAVRLNLKKKGDDVTFDFSETDDQARGTINFIMDEAVPKLMYGLFATADDPTALLNYGCIRALGKVITREGSLLKPRFPAPLGQRAAAWLRVNSCVLGAIGVANGGLAPASSPYFVIVSTRWQDPETKEFGFFFDGPRGRAWGASLCRRSRRRLLRRPAGYAGRIYRDRVSDADRTLCIAH